VAETRSHSVRVIDMRMHDGSRHFGDIPENYDPASPEWHRIKAHVPELSGAALTGFVTDDVTEAWIDFSFRGHEFSINNQHAFWWFFVNDPECPEELLVTVLDHFEVLLNPHGALARTFGPMSVNDYRVLVYEPDARVTSKDFPDLDQARQYADDAASESENGIVQALVLNGDLCTLHVGRHYGER
jgi:hypothetical protein